MYSDFNNVNESSNPCSTDMHNHVVNFVVAELNNTIIITLGDYRYCKKEGSFTVWTMDYSNPL